jgi:hypothetical protein
MRRNETHTRYEDSTEIILEILSVNQAIKLEIHAIMAQLERKIQLGKKFGLVEKKIKPWVYTSFSDSSCCSAGW